MYWQTMACKLSECRILSSYGLHLVLWKPKVRLLLISAFFPKTTSQARSNIIPSRFLSLSTLMSWTKLMLTDSTPSSSAVSTSQQVRNDPTQCTAFTHSNPVPVKPLSLTRRTTGNKPPSTVPAKAKHSSFELKRACKYFETPQLTSPPFFPMLSILVSAPPRSFH